MNTPIRLAAALIASFAIALPAAQARVLPEKDMKVFMQSRRTLRSRTRAAAEAQTRKRLAALVPLPNVFTDSDTGISIRYPAGWEKQELKQYEENLMLVVMFLSPDAQNGLRENINLVLEDMPDQDMTLDQYTALGLQKEEEIFDDFRLLSNVRTLLAGKTAQEVSFSASTNGFDMTFRQLWFFHKGKVHVWTFADESSGFAAHVPTFEAMMESLVID